MSKELDKLIERVLNEKLPYNWVGNTQADKLKKLADKDPLSGQAFNGRIAKPYLDISGLDDNAADVSLADLKAGLTSDNVKTQQNTRYLMIMLRNNNLIDDSEFNALKGIDPAYTGAKRAVLNFVNKVNARDFKEYMDSTWEYKNKTPAESGLQALKIYEDPKASELETKLNDALRLYKNVPRDKNALNDINKKLKNIQDFLSKDVYQSKRLKDKFKELNNSSTYFGKDTLKNLKDLENNFKAKPPATEEDTAPLDNISVPFSSGGALPFFLMDRTVGPQNDEFKISSKEPRPNKKAELFADLIKRSQSSPNTNLKGNTRITGELIKDVIGVDPANPGKWLKDAGGPLHYRGLHTELVQLLRLIVDTYSQIDDLPQLYKDFETLLGNMPSSLPGTDYVVGQDAPIAQFPISSFMGEEGYSAKTSDTLVQLFENSFGGQGISFEKRLENLEKFTKDFQKGVLSSNNPAENFRNTTLLDFFRRSVQNFDASSAGFLFESFLAMLLAGTKMGGNQRLEDFVIGTNDPLFRGEPKPVTLKLYKEGATETASAFSSYQRYFAMTDKPVYSITGIKGSGERSVIIYYKKITKAMFEEAAKLKPTKDNKNPPFTSKGVKVVWADLSTSKPYWSPNGKRTNQEDKSPKFAVKVGGTAVKIDFGFMMVEDKQFYDYARDTMKDVEAQIGKMFQFYNNFKLHATAFLGDIDSKQGPEAVNDFIQMQDAAAEVFYTNDQGKFTGEKKKVVKSKSGRTIGVPLSKMGESKSHLDQLIEAIVKEKLLK